jgi:glycosyltransferase involved in cell wall biosynthesis
VPERIDIVLPCYNPGESWTEELIAFHRFMGDRYLLRYIVVNDGSKSDKIPGQIEHIRSHQIPVTLIDLPQNRGKGYALREGVKATTAGLILYTDIDFPFTNDSMESVMDALVARKHNIVAGFREENYYSNQSSVFRKQLSRAFRYFLKGALRMPVTDTQCGLKAFDEKGRCAFLATRIDRYLFDFEFIYSAVKNPELSVQPIPVRLKDDVVFTTMRLRILLQESLNLLSVLISRR